MSTDAPVRHQIPHPSGGVPLALSNEEAFALVAASKAVHSLDAAAVERLAGDAYPEERAQLLAAFSQLHVFLVANGWHL